MMKQYYYKLIYFILLVLQISCQEKDPTKRFKISEAEMIDVSNKIIDLEIEQIIKRPHLEIQDDYLIVTDLSSLTDRGILLFNKNSLEFVSRTGILGEGPGEITRYGLLANSNKTNEFWMPDFSKLRIFNFKIDSAILDLDYKPSVSLPFNNENFLTRFEVISDSMAVGVALEVLDVNSARVRLGRYNLNTGKTSFFGYEHPKLKGQKTRGFFDYSHKNKMMALSYAFHDLITVFDQNGHLKFNILGEKEFDNENGKLGFFSQIKITQNYIIAAYRNKPRFRIDENKRPISNGSEILLFFNLDGELIKIYNVGFEIDYFSVDETNARIFISFLDRETPIGYFQYD
ncbi:hypothetical protein Belba_0177 [Belliella baltica DSM 15883]|uniref:TolB-like 6-blade propeller-like n=1 Tax=Belliella baltica (strain DSM 15883 / CIP 108006 / LMG 21964 / BA134) TaxID=866536 RepID=I3Z0S8_BELBD|nr:BF3164 family lipoprotein [Belliella baltica]AFL82846.1 hypothetical protein Belba_0177 [Belliella baltica DSM 15883]